MPKLIIKTNYYKNPQSYHIDKYVRYIATRDGVEKQRGKKDNNPYTKAQQELMDKCIFTFTDVADMPELQALLDRADALPRERIHRRGARCSRR